MKRLRKNNRIVSVFCLATFLVEFFVPIIAEASTGGPLYASYNGYNPASVEENVSLVNGAFNYSVPVTSIPEYPMSISYTSGQGMNHEAGSFGFGFSGFSGAITRELNGLPDDVAGANLNYNYSNNPMRDATTTISASVSGGAEISAFINGFVGTSLDLTYGYNNYNGVHLGVGLGVGGGLGFGGSGGFTPLALGAGLGVGVDSRDEQATANFGIGVKFASFNKGFSSSLLGVGIGGSSPGSKKDSWTWGVQGTSLDNRLFEKSFNDFSNTGSKAVSFLANPLCAVNAISKSKSFALVVPPIPVAPPLSIGGSFAYSSQNWNNSSVNRKGYGFLYADQYDRSNDSHVADFTVEGENPFSNENLNNPGHIQKDLFAVSGMGISGNIELITNEYAVMSRNKNIEETTEIGIVANSMKTKTCEPWTRINKKAVSGNLDLLGLIKQSKRNKKNGESMNFEKTFIYDIDDNSSRDLNSNSKRLSNKPRMRFRGDFAGELNVSSNDFKDYDPNVYNLNFIPDSDKKPSRRNRRPRGFIVGNTNMVPGYMPEVSQEDGANYDNQPIKTSNQIVYFTINDIVNKYSTTTKGVGGNYVDADPAMNCNIRNSFFTHKRYIPQTVASSNLSCANNVDPIYGRNYSGNGAGYPNGSNFEQSNSVINSQMDEYNILTQLKNEKNKENIADIRIKKADGLTYIYNLPVFARCKTEFQLQGKGVAEPINDGDQYYSYQKNNGNNKDRNKSEINHDYSYPYAWLLTAMVGNDYIDFDNIPGPSDGDLGYWIKFKYVKVASAYKWRAPFVGLDHFMGPSIAVSDDDLYFASSGTKEIYELQAIESRDYTSVYNYQKRWDCFDAPAGGIYNGDARNCQLGNYYNANNANMLASGYDIGNNAMFATTQIDLFKKHTNMDYQNLRSNQNPYGKLLRSTKFYYDYSTSKLVPNNFLTKNQSSTIALANVSYYYDPNASNSLLCDKKTGKLTLRKIQYVNYDENGIPENVPSYAFFYSRDQATSANDYNRLNPKFDKDIYDAWGNYIQDSRKEDNDGVFYNHYTEIDPVQANQNATVFALTKINLPSGGSMEIDWEANAYGYVQDRKPFVMRALKPGSGDNLEIDWVNHTITVKVDITDIYRDKPTGQGLLELSSSILNNDIYGEFTFPQTNSTDFPKSLSRVTTASGYSKVKSIGAVDVSLLASTGRVYQSLTLENNVSGATTIPYCEIARKYLTIESKLKQVAQYKTGSTCSMADIAKFEEEQKDGVGDAFNKMVKNITATFKSSSRWQSEYEECFDSPWDVVFSELSFIRTPIYKAKYTGQRVRRITFSDNFQYATETPSRSNKYVTEYFYDEKMDGSGKSGGVVTIEPAGGSECVIDIKEVKGGGFGSTPAIFNSIATESNGYFNQYNANTTINSFVSRNKGKTVNKFYSPKDVIKDKDKFHSLTFASNFKGSPAEPSEKKRGSYTGFGFLVWIPKKRFGFPAPIPIALRWNRKDEYHVKSYAYTDMSDMYGVPKEQLVVDANGQEVSKTSYTYYGKSEPVKTIDGYSSTAEDPFLDLGAIKDSKPGRLDQVWSEAYTTRETDFKAFLSIFWFARTKRKFMYTNMKYSYFPPIIKEMKVVNHKDNINNTITYSLFDKYTGQPVEVRTTDSYGNTKITRNTPAYWKYKELGPKIENNANQNLLTAGVLSRSYLNDATSSNDNLLSVGASFFSKSDWKTVGGLLPSNHPSGQTGCDMGYVYKTLDNSQVDALYQTNGRARTSSGLDTYINSAVVEPSPYIYKGIKSYTYQTDILPANKEKGVFSLGNSFNFDSPSQTDAKWKLMTNHTLFDMDLTPVESKNLLDKYSSFYKGFNNNYTISAVANSSWYGAAFEGAENTYKDASNNLYLDDNKISISDAKVVTNKCNLSYANKTLSYAGLSNPVSGITFCKPVSYVANTPVMYLNVKFSTAGYPDVSRILIVSLDENGDVKMITHKGETFDGFYMIKTPTSSGNCNNNYSILYDKTVVTSLSFLNTPNSEFSAVINNNLSNLNCTGIASKEYTVPLNDCAPEVHTGINAFLLPPSKKGTLFTINRNKIPSAKEFERGYVAMVWVHESSPSDLKLCIEKGVGTTVTKQVLAPLSSPYAVAGHWKLLRVEMDAPAATDDFIKAYLHNTSTLTDALYDDFKVHPYQADMGASVYDHLFGRTTSNIGGDHFATYLYFDTRGRLVKSKVEIDKLGPNTIHKYLYNEQKKN